jgi:glycosyltransferase involved in cell wall biosynthesis
LKTLIIASWKSDFFLRECKVLNQFKRVDFVLINIIGQRELSYDIVLKYLFNLIAAPKVYLNDGIKCLDVEFYKAEKKLNFKYFLLKFTKRLHRRQIEKINLQGFDMVHLQSLKPAALFYNDVRWMLPNLPICFTEHNQFNLRGLDLFEQNIVTKVIRESKLKIGVSRDKIRQFAANGYHIDMNIIGNCVDEAFITGEFNSERNDLGLVHVGAFDSYKDQDNLFQALNILDEIIDFKLEFCWIGYNGWGNVNEEIVLSFLKNFTFKNINVLLKPFIDKSALKDIFQKNGLYIVSSVSEGLSVAMLEALASGMFVISTRCGGSEDVITVDNGVLVSIKNPIELAKVIQVYMNNSSKIDRDKISKEIIQQYGPEEFSERLYSCYNETINNTQ